MKLILISKKNLASQNISKILIEKLKPKKSKKMFDSEPILELKNIDTKIVFAENEVTHLDYLEEEFKKLNPKIIIVASSHKAKTKIPTLTCHSPGNWSSADYGGTPKTLSIAPAHYLKHALINLKNLKEERKLKYEVSLEVTHHGPSLEFPIIFIEVGSSEVQWQDMKACEAAADTIIDLVTKKISPKDSFIGFGGGHYAPIFTKRILEQKIAIGHICPKYQIHHINKDMLFQALQKTIPKPKAAIIEWKGLNKDQRDSIIKLLEATKTPWIKDKDLKK